MSDLSTGSISQLWRYPVKSMKGEALESALVTDGGLLGDRAYALIDASNGKVASAKFPRKWARLLEFGASFALAPRVGAPMPAVRLAWSPGEEVLSSFPDVDARLGEAIGRQVRLTTKRPAAVSLERLDPLAEAETILDIGEIMMEGRFSDYAAVHIVTTATLARLAELGSNSRFDVRRFRPNLVIDTGDKRGFVENSWVGKTIAIGDDVRLRISDPTPRCSIPTLAQEGLPKDPQILRAIVEHNRLPVPLLDGETLPCVGVYGFVIEGGNVGLGDAVRVV